MCHRVVCHDCGKFTWEGCGLHIAQALAGLSLEQICSCDDDRDSEHSWATITASSQSSTTASTLLVPPRGEAATRYPLPYSVASAAAASAASLSSQRSFGAVAETCHDDDSSANSSTIPAAPADPVEYKLSKISATSATEAAIRMAQQAAALEELKRRKMEKDRELRESNQGALEKLLQGLTEAKDGDDGSVKKQDSA